MEKQQEVLKKLLVDTKGRSNREKRRRHLQPEAKKDPTHFFDKDGNPVRKEKNFPVENKVVWRRENDFPKPITNNRGGTFYSSRAIKIHMQQPLMKVGGDEEE